MQRLAWVTGAANGLGRAITFRFVQDGMRVLCTDIDEAGLAHLADELGDDVVTARCDVTSEDDVAAAAGIARELGGLDVVVANAGAGTFGFVVDLPLSEWKRMMDLCLTGVFLTLQHGGRVLHDGGSVITISSLNGIQPALGMSAYGAAKAGVIMLTRIVAMELGPRGIRANAIAPGFVETNATAPMQLSEALMAEWLDNIPVGRLGQPRDIAALASFLAGHESTYISGSVFSVDGGGSTGRYPDIAGFRRQPIG